MIRFPLYLVLFLSALLAAGQAPSAGTSPAAEARTAAARKDWTLAIERYRAALAKNPDDLPLLLEYAGTLRSSGNIGDAIAVYRSMLEKRRNHLGAELGLAECLRQIHNFDEARRLYAEALRQHPGTPSIWLAQAEMELELENYDAAIAGLKRVVSREPRNLRARGELAGAYKAKGAMPAALAELGRILTQDPKNALVYYLRASIYADQGSDAKAYRDAETLLQLAPDNASGRTLLAKVATRLNKCDRAIEVLKPVADTATDSQLFFQLGRAYQCAGQADQAQTAMARFTQASQQERIQAERTSQGAELLKQAEAQAQSNHLQAALDLAQQAIDKDPQNGNAHALVAKIYFSAHRDAPAREAIDKALAINPIQPEYLYVRGKLLAREGKLDDALQAFGKATVINPRESDAFYEMGTIYRQMGDNARAAGAFRRALAISPGDQDYQRALAEVAPR